MANIRLHSLRLVNFKGARDFTLNLDGRSATIRGDNATGKSTQMDAFSWLLFDKDSNGKKDFQIKTVDSTGAEISNLDHSVEAVLTVDGEPISLTKTYREKWVKQRGSAKAELTGHTTEYTIDGVPKKQKEWQDTLAGLFGGVEQFKLLTNPAHFNSLHWQKRREILMAVCGDIADADVIASDHDLAGLTAILGRHSVDEHRKVIKAGKDAANKKLAEIPARIDELTRSMAAVAEYDRDSIEAEIATLDQRIADLKASAGDGGASELRTQRATVNGMLAEAKAKRDNDLSAARVAHQTAIRQARQAAEDTATEYARQVNKVKNLTADADRLNGVVVAMRTKFFEAQAEEFKGDGVCPACGQGLPEEQIAAATEKWNTDKAKRLADIRAEGIRLKGELTAVESELDAAKTARQAALVAGQEADKALTEALAVVLPTTHALDSDISSMEAQVVELTARINGAQVAMPDTSGLEAQRRSEQAKIAALDAAKQTAKRIEELKEDERKAAKEYERLEGELFLIERFTVRKVEMLEGKINSHFEVARFKLFDVQVNGGIAECCTTLVNGVPYGAGLNRGAEINVGLDIIKTLSRHYGMTGVVWIDNAEAVTRLADPGTQTIRLEVYEPAKKLEVTYHE